MSTQATPMDLQYTWQYRFEIDGLEAALVDDVTLPKATAEEFEKGEGGTNVNTMLPTGKLTIGKLTLIKAKPGYQGDSWAWDKLITAVEGPIGDALFTATLLELDKDGGIVNKWTWLNCWVQDVDFGKRTAKDKTAAVAETVVINVGTADRT